MNTQEIQELTYGSIIQLKDKDQSYTNEYFFISYICNEYIDLISLLSNEDHKLIYEDEIWKKEDTIITEVILRFQPKEGYAQANRLVPGTRISVIYKDNTGYESIECNITQLEDDMITIEDVETSENYYIDFKYAGLDPTIIHSIKIKDSSALQPASSRQHDEDLLSYDMEQQIGDYINTMSLYTKNRKIIMKEVQKYAQLIELYSNLESGVLYEEVAKDQLLLSFLFLNPSFFYPLSSYVSPKKYSSQEGLKSKEMEDEDLESILEELKESPSMKQRASFVQNILFKENKSVRYHRFIKPDKDVFIWMNSVADNDIVLRKESKETTLGCVPKEKKFIINGILFHTEEKIKQNFNYQPSETIMSKAIQNEFPLYRGWSKMNISHKPENAICKPDSYGYVALNQYNKKWNHFIKQLKIKPSDIYEIIQGSFHLNAYEILQQLSIIQMEKTNTSDIRWIMVAIRKNIQEFKRNLQEKLQIWRETSNEPHEFYHYTELYSTMCGFYNESNLSLCGHAGEIFDLQHIDDGKYVMYNYQFKNKDLKLDLNDKDIYDIISELNTFVQNANAANKPENAQKKSIKHVKTYESLQALQNDENKNIILKDPPEQFENMVQYLYNIITSQPTKSYNDPIDVFNQKLGPFLETYESSFTPTQLKDLQTKIFDKHDDLFHVLMNKVIEFQVRQNDKCYVKQEKEYYVYNEKKWVPLNEHEEKVRNKKILRVQNAVQDIETSNEVILNDYVHDLVQQIHNEEMIKQEVSEKTFTLDQTSHLLLIRNKKNNKMRGLLKYNKMKQEQERLFDLSSYRSNIVISPYEGLFYTILSMENLDEKYRLIMDFISTLTIDLNDKDWFYCILTNTKLVPKFYHKLCISYLNDSDHAIVIKQICLEEGTISESGDTWIHINTGMIIQNIYFDTNYGYDENGFKIQHDEVTEPENEEKAKKMVILTRDELRSEKLVNLFMNTLGLDPKSSLGYDKNQHIKNIYMIYQESLKREPSKNKSEELNDKKKCFASLSYLFIYVQCNPQVIRKSYPGCTHSFKGYPLETSFKNTSGIEYMACILTKLAKSNKSNKKVPYSAFVSSRDPEIVNSMVAFMKKYTLVHPQVAIMLRAKQDIMKLQQSNDENEEYQRLQQFSRFYPSLNPIELKNMDITSSKQKNDNYDAYHKIQDENTFQHLKVQDFLQNALDNHKELPLLTTRLGQPYLLNYCCNQSEYIITHLCDTKQKQVAFNDIQTAIKDKEEMMHYLQRIYINSQNVCFVKQHENMALQEPLLHFNDEVIVYMFIIHCGNFDNDKPVMSFAEEIISEKPNQSVYDRNDTLVNKIQSLKDNDFKYTLDTLTQILKKKASMEAKPFVASTGSSNSSVLEEVGDFLDVSFSTMSMNDIERYFETQIKALQINIMSRIQTMEIQPNKLSTITNYFKESQRSSHYGSYNVLLQQLIYALLLTIPEFILSHKTPNSYKLLCEHWNFAEKHKQTLMEQQEDTFKMFESIDEIVVHSSEEQFLRLIKTMKSILYLDHFKENETIQNSYLSFVFYKLLYWYTMFDLNTQTLGGSNAGFIKKTNIAVYDYLNNLIEYSVNDYSHAKMVTRRLQQSEKQNMINSFEKMKPHVREVENLKKNLGLGKWAYGKGKQVFKYYKESYDDENERSKQVKTMMNQMYHANDAQDDFEHTTPMDVFGEPTNTFNEDASIYAEETDDLTHYEGDERYRQDGSIIEDPDDY